MCACVSMLYVCIQMYVELYVCQSACDCTCLLVLVHVCVYDTARVSVYVYVCDVCIYCTDSVMIISCTYAVQMLYGQSYMQTPKYADGVTIRWYRYIITATDFPTKMLCTIYCLGYFAVFRHVHDAELQLQLRKFMKLPEMQNIHNTLRFYTLNSSTADELPKFQHGTLYSNGNLQNESFAKNITNSQHMQCLISTSWRWYGTDLIL